jgi:isoleucyl-tRNA synthetase
VSFGYGPAEDVKRRLLTLWNSFVFLCTYGNIEGFRPRYADLEGGPHDVELRPLDRWLLARTQEFLAELEGAYERYWTPDVVGAFERFVDDLSNWYIRCSRRRFWQEDEQALRVLWHAIVQALRVVSPVLPFFTDHLWQVLVREPCGDAPASVFLAGWPEERPADAETLAAMAEVRRVVDLGRVARSSSGVKLRQPLPRLVVEGAMPPNELVPIVRDELRVKNVELGHVEAELVVKPNLPVLGPKLGKELGPVRAALAAGEFEELGGGRFRAGGRELEPEEVLVERAGRDGWAIASAEGVTVALDTHVDESLRREGRVYELIHRVNSMRKEAGLAITDRISLSIPTHDADLVEHAEWIKAETLATSLDVDGEDLTVAKV